MRISHQYSFLRRKPRERIADSYMSAVGSGRFTVSSAASTPGHRNKCIGRRLNAPSKKPVGETPTGSALFDYALGVTSGAGSGTIVNTKVLGIAKKSPPRTVAVTMYLPGALGMVLFA